MKHIDVRNGLDKRRIGGWSGIAAILLTVCLAPAARADGPGQPNRAVRLSYVDGQVQIVQGGQTITDQAVMNTPLFEGMQLTTSDSGRAEIQFEDGSVARLSPDSSITLSVLRGAGPSGDAEMTLNNGLAYFELQGTSESGQMAVHFGDATATASGFTVLRIKMDTPPGELAVFSGNAHVDRGNGALALDLHGGESVTLSPASPSVYVLAESIDPDSWDTWNSDRDQALTAQAATETGAASNISPDESQNPAWSDLDANGNWYDVPGQGYVWSPYDAANAGWDPYGYGDWTYSPGYGYIWASGYNWGYLPYSCGAWNFYNGFGWGWAPGMGGCQPWWGSGFYGGPRFGGFLPGGYRPPRRPVVPPGPVRGHPIPMIAVNRGFHGGGSNLPLRDRNTQVTIAGNTVQALRPLPMRPGYERPSEEFASHEQILYGNTPTARMPSGAPRPGYTASRNTYSPGAVRSYSAPAPRSAPAPSRSYSGGGGSAPRMSGGGGGGGGGPHGGGGGGGGGGGHK